MDFKRYNKTELESLEQFLQEARDDNKTGILEVIKEIRSELNNRIKYMETKDKIKNNYLGKYVQFDYGTGLGIYSIFKVDDVKYNEFEETIELKTLAEIYICDGIYSIEEDSVISINPNNINNLEITDKPTYDIEFDKAIEHYKSLREENDYTC